MNHLDFDQGSLTVTWSRHSIALLPKEYALLEKREFLRNSY